MLFISLFYVLVPLLLIGIIAFKRQPNVFIWVLTVLSFGSVMAYLWATARWETVSIYFRPLLVFLFLIACIIGFKRIRKPEKAPKKTVKIFNIMLHAILIIFFSGLNWFSYKGYIVPENTTDVASPFRSGKQIVLHGGASPFTNGHYHVKPQNYALDIVGLNSIGMRASSISGGSNLDDYVIYGTPVYSPMNGIVTIVVDGFEDQIPPKTDLENPAGNHVLIEVDGVEILLAHFKAGSIVVQQGDVVTTNTLLGKVGNSGNTSEPHLHIHMEKYGTPNTILDGKAVPFTLNNQFLVRGDILKMER